MTEIAVRTPLQRTRRAAGQALSLLLWLLTLLLVLCQATIWYGPESPLPAVLDQFAVQLTGLAVIAAVLALVLRRWLRLAVLAVLAATLAWPVIAQRGQAAVTEPARLKILSANVWHSASGHDRTLQALLASDADIVGLVEVTPGWRAALAPLVAKYPYHVDCFDADPDCQIILLSRLPIAKPYAGRIRGTTPIVAGGELMWNGRPITVLATHLFRPLARSDESMWGGEDPAFAAYLADRLPLSRQAGQAGRFAKYLNGLPDDLIIMGDFNSAPWSRVQRAFRGATGLDSQAGWDLTWPSSFPWPLRLPLDHVLARGHLAVTSSKAGPRTDSDHLPVFAEIGWRE
jgi:endonuclease/exonuclease/phosphatase (EEP) superfamily protein YafD